MTKIIINPNRVGELGTWAEAVTGIPGWLGYHNNPGDGVVYHSNRRQKSWRGPRAAHRCASYLFGVIQASARGRSLLADPEHTLAILKAAVQLNPAEFNLGQSEAESAIREARARGGRDYRAIVEAGA